MTDILVKILDNWHWIVVLFFAHSSIKLGINSWLKIVEIRTLNKNVVIFNDNEKGRTIEIRTHDISLEKVQKLKESLNPSNKAS